MAKAHEAHDKLIRELFEGSYLTNQPREKFAARQIVALATISSPLTIADLVSLV